MLTCIAMYRDAYAWIQTFVASCNKSARFKTSMQSNCHKYMANVLAKIMVQMMSQTSALSARASPRCRSEQSGLMPKCGCGTTKVEMPPESYCGPCPSASWSTPQKPAVHHHCTSPNHGESRERWYSRLVCLLSKNERRRRGLSRSKTMCRRGKDPGCRPNAMQYCQSELVPSLKKRN